MITFFKFHHATMTFDAGVEQWGGALLALALRVYVGLVFFKAGLTKIADWDTTLALFEHEYAVPLLSPQLAALFGTAGELVLPLMLWTGFLCRPAALGLFLVNAMAVISYPLLLTFDCPAAINDHRSWAILLLVLAVFGPGRLSADSMLSRARAGR